MAMNLEAVLRIAANVVGLSEVTQLEKAIGGAEKAAGDAKASFKGVVESASWQAAAVGAAALTGAIALSVNEAIKFESAMADVKKVVPGLDSAEGLKEMRDEILNLSRELPVSAEGLAAIMAAAGQAGIAREDLAEFTKQAAQMGVAFDITADEAGSAMAKMRTSMGLSQGEVVNLSDAMNFLSNNMASSAPELTDFMLRVGAFGQQVAMTEEQTAALGSAMIAAGAAPEVAATSFRNLIKELGAGVNATEKQEGALAELGLTSTEVAKRMQEDAVGTIRDVFERISRLPEEMQMPITEQIFGNEARALTPLITNMELFDSALGLVGDQTKYAGSMFAEFEARADTSANNFILLQNNVKALQIAIGDGLLPAINLLLGALTPMMVAISVAASEYPVLTAAVTVLATALAGLVILAPAIVSFISLLGSLSAVIGGLSISASIAGWLGAVGPAVAVAQAALAGMLTWVGSTLIPGLLAFFSGPVGWTVLAVAAVVAMALYFQEPLLEFFDWFVDLLGDWLKVFADWASDIPGFFADAWDAVMDIIRGFFAWFAGEIAEGLNALWEWGEPIREFWAGLWEGIKPFVTGYFEFLRGAFDVGLKVAWALVDTLFIQPWMALWDNLVRRPAEAAVSWLQANVFEPLARGFNDRVVKPIQDGWNGLVNLLSNAMDTVVAAVSSTWTQVTTAFDEYVVQPINEAWEWVTDGLSSLMNDAIEKVTDSWNGIVAFFVDNIATPIANAWNAVVEALPAAMESAANFVNGVWESMIQGINSAVNGMLSYIASNINSVADLINGLIRSFNALPGADIPLIPKLVIPAFAEGGTVDRATLAMVGEGGEREYIIPESKMQAASSRFLSGSRGSAVIPSTSSGGGSGGTVRAAQINITTGPVMQQQDGTRWLTVEDYERGLQSVAERIYSDLRRPETRAALGIS